jgi:ABC-type lipoprotein export system ATPase subunit
MFQESYFLPDVSIKKNIELPLILNNFFKVNGTFYIPERRAEVINIYKDYSEYFLDFFKGSGLFSEEELMEISPDDQAKNFSGGQLQRFALLRALIHKPSILFLDEPTGELDPVNADKVFVYIRKQITNNDTTVLLITHDLNLALKYSDYIFYAKEGSIKGQEMFYKNNPTGNWERNNAIFNNHEIKNSIYY